MAGPFARRRQAKLDERELGSGLWRRSHDWFVRSLDRYWQVIQEVEAEGKVPPEEVNGLINAGNVLTELVPRVRQLCADAHRHRPETDLQIPADYSRVHRILSRAANDLATTAQAAAMFRLGQSTLTSVGRRAEKVVAAVQEAEEAAAESAAESAKSAQSRPSSGAGGPSAGTT